MQFCYNFIKKINTQIQQVLKIYTCVMKPGGTYNNLTLQGNINY